MKYIWLFFLVLFFSCSYYRKDEKISVPVTDQDFYEKALNEISSAYKRNPSLDFLRQKIFYQEKLNWPESAKADLDDLLERTGLSKELVDLYCKYYLQHDKYKSLDDLLDKWELYHGLNEELTRYRILSEIKVGAFDDADSLISSFVRQFPGLSAIEFAFQQSVLVGDTAMIRGYGAQLAELQPTHRYLISDYVPVLLADSSYQEAYDLLKLRIDQENDVEWCFLISQSLYNLGRKAEAMEYLKPIVAPFARIQLTEWYRAEKRYDSAIYFLDQVISKDSSRNLLMVKADILEESGSLNSAYGILDYLVQQDSTDSIASARTQILARKIAYLRSLKGEASETSNP